MPVGIRSALSTDLATSKARQSYGCVIMGSARSCAGEGLGAGRTRTTPWPGRCHSLTQRHRRAEWGSRDPAGSWCWSHSSLHPEKKDRCFSEVKMMMTRRDPRDTVFTLSLVLLVLMILAASFRPVAFSSHLWTWPKRPLWKKRTWCRVRCAPVEDAAVGAFLFRGLSEQTC